ncbi:hypothetical protein SGM_4463 [Streptomyces griseoaurantiacus M045]|uniref:Uncharacterized protein n=1 Tax=Streptomyces griseoaurantiacus M045 TaxID=996637 RepID=F3NMU9_9ACTN|nr:hypothetical protein SGM_4463 [Streptomyces griseoaurantiacus M045]
MHLEVAVGRSAPAAVVQCTRALVGRPRRPSRSWGLTYATYSCFKRFPDPGINERGL